MIFTSEANVLVVDDVEAIRNFLRMVLGKSGFKNVDVAKDGDEVIQKSREKNYDLVFLDINMPGPDGLCILRWIRAKFPKTKVIMCSSNHSTEIVEEAEGLGATGFVRKPVVIKEFLSLLDNLQLDVAS